jgi:hypothetical protein
LGRKEVGRGLKKGRGEERRRKRRRGGGVEIVGGSGGKQTGQTKRDMRQANDRERCPGDPEGRQTICYPESSKQINEVPPHPTFDTAYNTHTMGRMGITWLYT